MGLACIAVDHISTEIKFNAMTWRAYDALDILADQLVWADSTATRTYVSSAGRAHQESIQIRTGGDPEVD